MYKIIAFIKRDFAIELSYRFAFLLRLARIVTTSLTFYFISRLFGTEASRHLLEYGTGYFPFVLIGIAFSEYLTTSLHSFSGNLRQEQITGTLEAVMTTPTGVPTIVIGSTIWDFVFTSISVIIYFILGVSFFGLDLSKADILATCTIFLLSIISFSSVGVLSAAFVLIFKKGDPLVWSIGTLQGLLGGVYFPIGIMPKPLQLTAHILPITYSLRSLRLALLKGYSLNMLLPDIGALLLFCILLLPLSIWVFKIAVKKAKLDGSLVHY